MPGIPNPIDGRQAQALIDFVERVWHNIEECPETGCWLWQGAMRGGSTGEKKEYGAVKIRQKLWSTHKLAYLAFHGEIDPGMHVDHQCSNGACCNPHHLSQATPTQNTAWAVDKRLGRGRHSPDEQDEVPF